MTTHHRRLAVAATATTAAAATSAIRFTRRTSRARQAAPYNGPKVDAGAVDWLTIRPLVEARSIRDDLVIEPGVSYLVQTDTTTILFDLGLNRGNRRDSALLTNAKTLGIDLDDIDAVVISHPHFDHRGGLVPTLRGEFAPAASYAGLPDVPAFVPSRMKGYGPRTELVVEPRPLCPGVASTGPLPRMLFFLGWTPEQSLVVTVRGIGAVVIIGCGHPGIGPILDRVEATTPAPVAAIIGGLHLPVHGLRAQAILGSARWPWQPPTEADVDAAITTIAARHPRLVALSPHDSSPWALETFAQTFDPDYNTIALGQEIRLDSTGIHTTEIGAI